MTDKDMICEEALCEYALSGEQLMECDTQEIDGKGYFSYWEATALPV